MEDIIIDMNTTLDFEQVKTIITEYIEQKTQKTICDITPVISDDYLTGLKITYESEHANNKNYIGEFPQKPIVVDKTFKPMSFY